jgi:hypothetical protein
LTFKPGLRGNFRKYQQRGWQTKEMTGNRSEREKKG